MAYKPGDSLYNSNNGGGLLKKAGQAGLALVLAAGLSGGIDDRVADFSLSPRPAHAQSEAIAATQEHKTANLVAHVSNIRSQVIGKETHYHYDLRVEETNGVGYNITGGQLYFTSSGENDQIQKRYTD
jgi:hypothetical protein